MNSSLRGLLERVVEIRRRRDEIQEQFIKTRSKRKKAELMEENMRLARELDELGKQLEAYLEEIVRELGKIHRDFEGLNKVAPYHYARFEGNVLEIRTHWLHVKTLEEFDKVIEDIKEKIVRKYNIPVRLIIDGRYDHFPLKTEDRDKLIKKYNARHDLDFIIELDNKSTTNTTPIAMRT